MKKFILFARVCTWLLVISPTISSAQNLDVYPNYVVIGAFEYKKNAVFFTDDANQHNFTAQFEMNPNRNLYYVYVLTTDDREYAFAEALKLRSDTKYFDTWVFSGLLGEAALANAGSQDRDLNPATGEKILSVESEQARKTPGGSDRPSTSTDTQNPGSTLAADDLSVNSDDVNAQAGSKGRDNQNLASNGTEKAANEKRRTNRTSKEAQTSVSDSTHGSGNENDPSINSDANARTGSKGRGNENNNELEKTSSEESNVAAIDRGQNVSLSQSGNKANEKAKQVTITRSTNSPDQSKNGASTTDDGKERIASNDRRTAANDNTEVIADNDAKNAGTSNNLQNGSGKKESSLGSNSQLAADGQQVKTDTKSTAVETLEDGNTANNSLNRSMETTDDVANNNQAGVNGIQVDGDKKVSSMVMDPAPKQVSTEPLSKEEVTGKDFYFYVFRADNHDMVAGEVDAIDFEKARRMATYAANTQVKIIMPSGKSKQISFLCQVFGYRKLQKEFDPASPAEDMYLDDKGNVVVPFELMRLQKGDIAIMYNVFFFKDAAVMRPESRYEVNNLLELLQENPTYNIKIHGHTNGNAAGKIIYMEKPGNFYSLSNTRQGGGTAKKLSEERALVIREYLISSGILADRMKVEAWGGKKPIHDKHSARAHENVRVEIEILSD